MEKTTLTRTVVAGGIAAAGLTVGGIAMASAGTGTAVLPAGTAEYVVASEDGNRPRHGMMKDRMAEDLAAELDLGESKVADALEAVHEELRPDRAELDERLEDGLEEGERPAPPTEEEMAERQEAFAAALAEELGISTEKVTAALEAIRADARADAREAFAERLDAAVADGDLTAADKASVLKAFDAGVLGGGPGGFHHRIG